jgi:hypothetical protein
MTVNVIMSTVLTTALSTLFFGFQQIGHVLGVGVELLQSFDTAHCPSPVPCAYLHYHIRQRRIMLNNALERIRILNILVVNRREEARYTFGSTSRRKA